VVIEPLLLLDAARAHPLHAIDQTRNVNMP
jgi:hypothetical protein